jgi:hypothetical protein
MADERDPKVSQRYRELGADEPPRRLDDAILAASRRRWRWAAPLAAAAVIMLSVAVTWHMQVERPDPESAVLMQAPEPAQEVVEERKQAEESRADSAPRRKREVPPAAPVPAPAPARDEAAPAAGARALEAPAGSMLGKQLAEEPPETVLERIAEMRKQGRHEEADKALEAFRKRYPDYKLPESVLKK